MAKFGAGSLSLIAVFYFSFKRDVFLMIPLGSTALSHLRPRFAYILGNYEHSRSQGGRQPVAAKPGLYNHTTQVRVMEVSQLTKWSFDNFSISRLMLYFNFK